MAKRKSGNREIRKSKQPSKIVVEPQTTLLAKAPSKR